MEQSFGVNAVLTIFSHLIFIVMVWRTLIALRFDKLLKPNRVREGQLLLFFVAVGLGYLVSSCFLALIAAVRNLAYLI
ncbi:DUF1146 family protein [Lacticaseibacillus songhuajiangensis]|jgi:uncharacterized integral membrane protein (TIGR02327 family)|uniref:DUF1146 family protein n=1 Tax=Lacticaseibacillus songhuajiangensis TaxID=1296539 RepID=UPI000F7727A5|nr:DUF1146 family protein [Lacticaseibacillus songhuajiangensis]MCI1284345.1 DUF1146 family protein [Lacticaseibacillus songhuajiangensis]